MRRRVQGRSGGFGILPEAAGAMRADVRYPSAAAAATTAPLEAIARQGDVAWQRAGGGGGGGGGRGGEGEGGGGTTGTTGITGATDDARMTTTFVSASRGKVTAAYRRGGLIRLFHPQRRRPFHEGVEEFERRRRQSVR
eukprot:GHVU01222645.1.p1 GENE.GHVU01222645.1~~GHVU01222645.1.p1  ORF type:complete len:139 (+),score=19.70 GHVU01222645.1:273-689(+)